MDIAQNQPVNRAFLALNHYISTGDHVGEGVALGEGNKTVLLITWRPREWEDNDNWKRLRARLEELKGEGFALEIREMGANGEFSFAGAVVETSQLDEFATKITERRGPLGWGSMKTFLERNGIE